MTDRSGPPQSAWVVVGVLWVVALLNYLDRQLVANMGGPIRDYLVIDEERFGLLSTVFMWVYGICSPIAGFIADLVGRRTVIFLSLIVWSAATLWTGASTGFQEMLAARAVMGISEAFYIPAALALIVDHHRGPTRSMAVGLHLSGVYVGSIAGGFGGFMAAAWGWQTPFFIFGVLGIAYSLVIVLLIREPEARAETETEAETEAETTPTAAPLSPVARQSLVAGLLMLFGSVSFLVLLLGNAAIGAANWTIRNWLPEMLRTEIGVRQEWSSVVATSSFNLAAFIGNFATALIAARYVRSHPRIHSVILACGCAAAVPCYLVIGSTPAVAFIAIAAAVIGIAQGCLDSNLMPAACTIVPDRLRATAYGMLNLVGICAGAFSTYFFGRLKKQGVPLAQSFLIATAFVLIAVMAFALARPRPISATPSDASPIA